MKRELQLWLIEHKPTLVLCATLLGITLTLTAITFAPKISFLVLFAVMLTPFAAFIASKVMRYN